MFIVERFPHWSAEPTPLTAVESMLTLLSIVPEPSWSIVTDRFTPAEPSTNASSPACGTPDGDQLLGTFHVANAAPVQFLFAACAELLDIASIEPPSAT